MPDNKRLRAFDKIELNPGETKTVSLKLKGSDLAFVGADEKWILEAGDFTIAVASEKLILSCTKTRKWLTPTIE
jgi:beta-glucosidase